MENISSFLRACRVLGVSEHDLFETVDLYEEKSMGLVVQCIFALGRCVQVTVPTYAGPALGPRMATANKRDFSEEQLARGQQAVTKVMQASQSTMERTHISDSDDITFGQNAGAGAGAGAKR